MSVTPSARSKSRAGHQPVSPPHLLSVEEVQGGWEEACSRSPTGVWPCGANRDWEEHMAGKRVSGHQSISASARIKPSCPCLRAWLRQHQNRKRERLGDSQGLNSHSWKANCEATTTASLGFRVSDKSFPERHRFCRLLNP